MSSTKAEAVIWIASYPKSGNTWVQAVTRGAGRAFGFPTEDIDVYKMKAANRQPVVVRGVREDVTDLPATVLKTHAPYTRGGPHRELGLKTVGYVYVMRNPLDMLLSYINFTRVQYDKNRDVAAYQERLFIDLLGFERVVPYETWVETKLEDIPRANLDHALARFGELRTEVPGLRMAGGTWLEHCRSWRGAAKHLPAVLLRYEDLLTGPRGFLPLQRLFTFSDEEIVDAASRVDQGLRALQGKKIFFNRMSAYYFHEFFSKGAIRAFLDRFETDLRGIGYADLYDLAQA